MTKYILLVGLMSCLSCMAFAMEERVTLMLTGATCTQSHTAIDSTLKQITGVRHVDLQAIPGHILVDIETGVVTADVLEDKVNNILATQPSCLAEIMKTCISSASRSARIP